MPFLGVAQDQKGRHADIPSHPGSGGGHLAGPAGAQQSPPKGPSGPRSSIPQNVIPTGPRKKDLDRPQAGGGEDLDYGAGAGGVAGPAGGSDGGRTRDGSRPGGGPFDGGFRDRDARDSRDRSMPSGAGDRDRERDPRGERDGRGDRRSGGGGGSGSGSRSSSLRPEENRPSSTMGQSSGGSRTDRERERDREWERDQRAERDPRDGGGRDSGGWSRSARSGGDGPRDDPGAAADGAHKGLIIRGRGSVGRREDDSSMDLSRCVSFPHPSTSFRSDEGAPVADLELAALCSRKRPASGEPGDGGDDDRLSKRR